MLKRKKKKCIHWTLYRFLKASVSMLNINFHDNMIGGKPNMYGLFGKATRTKLIFSKKNMAAPSVCKDASEPNPNSSGKMCFGQTR